MTVKIIKERIELMEKQRKRQQTMEALLQLSLLTVHGIGEALVGFMEQDVDFV